MTIPAQDVISRAALRDYLRKQYQLADSGRLSRNPRDYTHAKGAMEALAEVFHHFDLGASITDQEGAE